MRGALPLIGVIEAREKDRGQRWERNDRLIGVASHARTHEGAKMRCSGRDDANLLGICSPASQDPAGYRRSPIAKAEGWEWRASMCGRIIDARCNVKHAVTSDWSDCR